jgi:hypothetical protein
MIHEIYFHDFLFFIFIFLRVIKAFLFNDILQSFSFYDPYLDRNFLEFFFCIFVGNKKDKLKEE